MQEHACFDSQNKIKNQVYSTPSFNVLATGGFWLGTSIQNPKTNSNWLIMSAQDHLHNTKHNK